MNLASETEVGEAVHEATWRRRARRLELASEIEAKSPTMMHIITRELCCRLVPADQSKLTFATYVQVRGVIGENGHGYTADSTKSDLDEYIA